MFAMRKELIISILFLTITVLPMVAHGNSYYEYSDRNVTISINGTVVTTTHVSLYLDTYEEIARMKRQLFQINSRLEEIKLEKGECYFKNAITGKENLPLHITLEKDFSGSAKQNIQSYHLIIPDMPSPVTIEYQMRVTSKAPLMKNEFWSMHNLGAELPVKSAAYNISLPADLHLFYVAFGFTKEPEIISSKNDMTYRWNLENLSAHVKDLSNSNELSNAIEAVYISSTPDWKPVAEYLTSEFESKVTKMDNINEVIRNLTGKKTDILGESDIQSKLHMAIFGLYKFKQTPSEEMFTPRLASETLERKRGDCKDLAVLLVSLLRSAGVESYPVLVSSDFKGNLESMLPYPYLFDHALVYIPLQYKTKYQKQHLSNRMIVDPTKPYKVGPFIGSYGLVLKKGAPFFVRL